MNIIFLDIDGVLNSVNKLIEIYHQTKKPHSGYQYPFDEKCLRNLQMLVQETDAKIVVTSTWRKDEEGKAALQRALKEYGLDERVIGYTPVLFNQKRGREIEEYLSQFETRPNFVILDDDLDMENLLPFLVKTDMQTGLTHKNAREAIERLRIKTRKEETEMERE